MYKMIPMRQNETDEKMIHQPISGKIVQGIANLVSSYALEISSVILEGLDFQRWSLIADKAGYVTERFRLWDWVEDASNQTGFLPYRTVPFEEFLNGCEDNYDRFLSFVSNHYENNQQDILHSIELQIETMAVSEGPKATLQEAIQAHRRGLFRLTCRGLLPDIERAIYKDWLGESGIGGVRANKIEDAIGDLPARVFTYYHWSDLVLLRLLTDHLYSNGSNIKDFQEKPFPNRHAALHGWLDYPLKKDSLNAIILADYIFRQGTLLKKFMART